jgi:hypothetical protein
LVAFATSSTLPIPIPTIHYTAKFADARAGGSVCGNTFVLSSLSLLIMPNNRRGFIMESWEKDVFAHSFNNPALNTAPFTEGRQLAPPIFVEDYENPGHQVPYFPPFPKKAEENEDSLFVPEGAASGGGEASGKPLENPFGWSLDYESYDPLKPEWFGTTHPAASLERMRKKLERWTAAQGGYGDIPAATGAEEPQPSGAGSLGKCRPQIVSSHANYVPLDNAAPAADTDNVLDKANAMLDAADLEQEQAKTDLGKATSTTDTDNLSVEINAELEAINLQQDQAKKEAESQKRAQAVAKGLAALKSGSAPPPTQNRSVLTQKAKKKRNKRKTTAKEPAKPESEASLSESSNRGEGNDSLQSRIAQSSSNLYHQSHQATAQLQVLAVKVANNAKSHAEHEKQIKDLMEKLANLTAAGESGMTGRSSSRLESIEEDEGEESVEEEDAA